jgi:hypothetical protein
VHRFSLIDAVDRCSAVVIGMLFDEGIPRKTLFLPINS